MIFTKQVFTSGFWYAHIRHGSLQQTSMGRFSLDSTRRDEDLDTTEHKAKREREISFTSTVKQLA